MNQWVKSLLCKHEDPHKKMSLTACTYSLELEGKKERSEAYLLVHLAKWQAPGLGSVRDLLQRKKLYQPLQPLVYTGILMNKRICIYTHTHQGWRRLITLLRPFLKSWACKNLLASASPESGSSSGYRYTPTCLLFLPYASYYFIYSCNYHVLFLLLSGLSVPIKDNHLFLRKYMLEDF